MPLAGIIIISLDQWTDFMGIVQTNIKSLNKTPLLNLGLQCMSRNWFQSRLVFLPWLRGIAQACGGTAALRQGTLPSTEPLKQLHRELHPLFAS